ncbi:Exportin-T-like protein [Elsinoe fawcettii]|nr:Exportin-T-like protein [Elsinoe fawcettii]
MDAQVENAIEIAFNPSTDPNLKSQAYTFLEQLRTDPSGWQVCLSLFVRSPAPSEVVRHVSLEVVNNAVQTQKLDQQGLQFAKENLWDYVQRQYGPGSGGVDVTALQNKLTQTLTYLFTSLYGSTWTTFFDDFKALAGDAPNIGSANPAGTTLYLRLLRSIHDEIADVLIPRSQDEHKRNTELKDIVRQRDAAMIATSWQEILSKWREVDLDIVELCLKCVSRWVSWIDISFIVNPDMLSYLWDLAGQQVASSESGQGRVRLAAIDTLNEIVAKKMAPNDKIELIRFLNLADVLGQLVASPGLSEYRSTSNYDTDLGETVAKLTNTVLFDIIKVLETNGIDESTGAKADELLQLTVPYLLRFFSDEYDEICSSVIPSMTDLLTMFRRKVKVGVGVGSGEVQMLQPILDTIIIKMKFDETADWGAEDDQTDEAEFQELRKRLHVLQQTVAAVDEGLFMNTISRIVAATFNGIDAGDRNITWRELDLALHEMYLFGELAVKTGSLYQKGAPSNEAARHLVDMMTKLVTSDLAAHPHPAIQIQYLEICVRYCPFFEHNTSLIGRAFENFVRFIHSDHAKVRTRSWYLFYKFVKQLRGNLGGDAQTVMQSFGDLLQIRAEVPDESAEDDDSSEVNDQSADAVFNAQLYLFEAIGCIASTPSISIQDQTYYARSLLEPLVSDLNSNLPPATNGDDRSILQVHHVIMAIGTLAKGFCDWMPGVSSSGPPPANELSAEFHSGSEAILGALEALKSSMHIRTAARSAFSRMLGVLGSRILQQLPRWIEGLLSQTSTKDEMATFLRLLDQVVFGFKTEISSILDSLLTPLLQRVFSGLSEPTTGTDDEIQLAELKSQYLNFILVILNNDLASVIVSQTNQGNFEPILQTLEHFCRDASDYATARLSFGVLSRMTIVWGGPDLPVQANGADASSQEPAPVLPGFDNFAMMRFSPLTWALISSPSFNHKDAQARSALQEAASLQWTILRKCGARYEAYLREQELPGIGFQGNTVDEYVGRLKDPDQRAWKKHFTQFVAQARGG